MNKAQLISAVQTHLETSGYLFSREQITAIINAQHEVIVDAVAAGDDVTIVNFGKYEPRNYKGREGKNPKTGEKVDIPPRRTPCFSPGKLFKDRVNNLHHNPGIGAP